jgi:hypothetical protein
VSKEKWIPCDAVMLLMDRMESHHEEFSLTRDSKWGDFFVQIKKRVVDNDRNTLIILDDRECEMLWGKFKECGKKQLHAYVMKKILNPNGAIAP